MYFYEYGCFPARLSVYHVCSRWQLTQRPIACQVQRRRDWEYSALNGTCHTSLLKGHGSTWKKMAERCKSQRWSMTSVTQCFPDTAGQLYTWTNSVMIVRQKQGTEERGWTWSPTSSSGVVGIGWLLGRGKFVFFNRMTPGLLTTL